MATKARQFKKFIGSSADDSYGAGAILEGLEAAKNEDGLLYLNVAKAGKKPEWVEVFELVEVAVKTTIAVVDPDSLPETEV